MRDRLADFGEQTQVVLVTFTEADQIDGYQRRNALSFPILLDRDRQTYRSYGLGRASLMRVWGLRAARRYLEIFRSHGAAGLARPTEDTRQLGGDFVIDPSGRLAYGFWGQGPDDRPSVDELIAAVARH